MPIFYCFKETGPDTGTSARHLSGRLRTQDFTGTIWNQTQSIVLDELSFSVRNIYASITVTKGKNWRRGLFAQRTTLEK